MRYSNDCNSRTVYRDVVKFCTKNTKMRFHGGMSSEFFISRLNLNYASIRANLPESGCHGNRDVEIQNSGNIPPCGIICRLHVSNTDVHRRFVFKLRSFLVLTIQQPYMVTIATTSTKSHFPNSLWLGLYNGIWLS